MKKNIQSKLKGWDKLLFLVIVDLALFGIVNAAICYFTTDGRVMDTPYASIFLQYSHFALTSTLVLIIHSSLGLFKSVWRFASTYDAIRGFIAAFLDIVGLFIIDRFLYYRVLDKKVTLPFYAYILGVILLFFAVLAPRLGFRFVRNYFYLSKSILGSRDKSKRIMIVGAGFMGNFVIDELANKKYVAGRPIVAIDDNPAKKHKRIGGVKVVGTCDEIPQFVKKYDIEQILICLPSATITRRQEIISIAMKTDAEIKISASIDEILEGANEMRKLRNVEISDLLSRPEISLDKKVCDYLFGKTILVTGGGGSIGSELCMQIARYKPETIVIFDVYENTAYELQNELYEKYSDKIEVAIRIGTVRDINRLRDVFKEFKPDVVFHAAAHKHVPLMEDSPCEAVKNNIFGTYNTALVADEFKVSKMVIISTDKAVNPTNVMGATKRITELIAQYMNNKSENTSYAAVRFGNVLGSHGSVIPLFKKQIEAGGPVRVTHQDITRYFMTIPEAAQLVCQSGGLSKGGEVFVLDMGEPVKIMDLAKNLIQLSGYTEEEMPIVITGLRPGEKLYEELAMEDEMAARKTTENKKIFVTQPIEIDDEYFESMIESLKEINDTNVRQKLRKIVTNYHDAETELNGKETQPNDL